MSTCLTFLNSVNGDYRGAIPPERERSSVGEIIGTFCPFFESEKWNPVDFKDMLFPNLLSLSPPAVFAVIRDHEFLPILPCMHASLLQSCPTLQGPPGSSVYGTPQARILEWVARLSSRGTCWPRIKLLSPMSPALASKFFITSATLLPWKLFNFLIVKLYRSNHLMFYNCNLQINSHDWLNVSVAKQGACAHSVESQILTAGMCSKARVHLQGTRQEEWEAHAQKTQTP